MEIYEWKWMVLGALGSVNKVDFETKLVNDNNMLDVFIVCYKLQHVQAI